MGEQAEGIGGECSGKANDEDKGTEAGTGKGHMLNNKEASQREERKTADHVWF